MSFVRHIQFVFQTASHVRHTARIRSSINDSRRVRLGFPIALTFCANHSYGITCMRHITPLFVLNNGPPASNRQTERVRIAITEIVSYLYSTLSKSFSLQRFYISLHRGKLHYDPFQKHNALRKLWGIRTHTENSCILFCSCKLQNWLPC